MLTDAHCHPFDLSRVLNGAEEERRRRGVMCAASATELEEFAYNEELARRAKAEGSPPLLPCFAVHPQLPAARNRNTGDKPEAGLLLLETLAREGRLAAVGETGFDLFNSAFRETEAIQDKLFAAQVETALCYGLPLVLHIRKAMHKVFAYSRTLTKCKAVIFHSWPGTLGEGEALLKRGVNAFFSFGNGILLNHREAMRCCAAFPLSRLLIETDAPYQPPRGREHSAWEDLPGILAAATALRREAGTAGSLVNELETAVESNFRSAFGRRAS
ncbi:MAG: TatD family hydrolase [Treponema sp.]|jgi:TatD DNase family protein|nr:TatD family hydrolase [Treponema sp.]